MKRGAVKKSESRQMLVWIPTDLDVGIGQAVEMLDTDRSKFARGAIREKLDRLGLLSAAAPANPANN
jgi:hypothetical protein